MRRLPNWRSKLHAVVEERRRLPIEYGVNDCAIFAADCVLAMTGEDLAADYRGQYHSREEAIQFLYRLGYDDLVSLVADKLPEISPVRAQIGDVAAIPSEPIGWALGIFNGETITVLREDALGTVRRELATRAFKCG